MKARKVVLATLLAATAACPAAASDRNKHHRDRIDSWLLTHFVTADRIHQHLRNLQRIADRNDDNRSLGTSGYKASVRYVADRLKRAHYKVTIQPFIANLFEERTPAVLEQTAPNSVPYVLDTDFATMLYSGEGDVTANLVPTNDIVIPATPDPSSSSGCEAADYPQPETTGAIALIQRGTCTFEEKAQAAAAAGAVGAIIFNEGNPGRTELLGGTLANEQEIPVVGTTFALGEDLYELAQAGPVTIHLKVDAVTTPIQTWNVLGEKKGRVKTQDVVVGAHLDSVPEGPGINDNGSGTATLLTIAEQMSRLHIKPRNTVRFAFWGAEEGGLFGSQYYVDTLTDKQFNNIALNLNFDMVGSPNFARFVYDGDGTLGEAGPPGSEVIEEVFTDFFDRRRQASEPTEFDGRSDYFAFINAGIPAGGLFSGAEGIKTPEQVTKYGGTAGVAYDPCYHQACDDIDNLSRRALSQFGKAAAHSVLYFAMTRENVRPPAAAAAAQAVSAAQKMDYRGNRLVR